MSRKSRAISIADALIAFSVPPIVALAASLLWLWVGAPGVNGFEGLTAILYGLSVSTFGWAHLLLRTLLTRVRWSQFLREVVSVAIPFAMFVVMWIVGIPGLILRAEFLATVILTWFAGFAALRVIVRPFRRNRNSE